MHTATVKRTLGTPAPLVWEAFDDFGGIHKFHPMVKSSPIHGTRTTGLGCERVCNFHSGGAITERITRYVPGREMTVQITDTGPFPLKAAEAHIRVDEAGEDDSVVTFSMSFEPKFGPVGWILAQLAMKRQFAKIIGQILDGLDRHLKDERASQRVGRLRDAA